MSEQPSRASGALCVPDDVVYRPAGDRIVVMSLRSGQYLALEDIGCEIWQRIVETESVDGAVRRLMSDFDVDERTCRDDVGGFVERLSSLGLLHAGTSSTAPPAAVLRLDRGSAAVGSPEAIAEAADHFRRHAYVRLRGVLAPPLLDELMLSLDRTPFVQREHHGIGVEECAVSGVVAGVLELMMNEPTVLDTVSAITGCGHVGCFKGRVYRLVPAQGHYDSWHDDMGDHRLVAIAINLSRVPFEGGALQLRRRDADAVQAEVVNKTVGDAIMFKVHQDYVHRVEAVRGEHARTVFAGWFKAEPDFREASKAAWRGAPLLPDDSSSFD